MLKPFLLFLLGILPVAFILYYVYKNDSRREPRLLLSVFFMSGIFSCFLVIQVSKILKSFIPLFNMSLNEMTIFQILLYAFLGVALVEELLKWIMVYFIGYYHKEFDESYDIIVYAAFVALGFAFLENILYLYQMSSIKTALLRAISSIPGHACDAVFMGYYLSLAKVSHLKMNYNSEKKYIVLSIILPVIFHGIYDFCLMSGKDFLAILFIAFILMLYFFSYKKLKETSSENKNIKNNI